MPSSSPRLAANDSSPATTSRNGQQTRSSPSSGALTPPKSRRNSLILPAQPPAVPIPPSLLQSPYLHVSMISLEPSAQPPSEEDERWLQDTVPLVPSQGYASHPHPPSAWPGPSYRPPPLTPPLRPCSATAGTTSYPSAQQQQSAATLRSSSVDGIPYSKSLPLVCAPPPSDRPLNINYTSGAGHGPTTSAGYNTRPLGLSPPRSSPHICTR